MGSRRYRDDDDDDDDEYVVRRENRITGGFGFGFFGSIGCICGIIFMFCVLPVGFLLSGGCVAKQAVDVAREREQADADRLANQKAAADAAAAAREAELQRIEAERIAEAKRLASPLRIGDTFRTKAGNMPNVSRTADGLSKLHAALSAKDERALIRIAEEGTASRLLALAKGKVQAIQGDAALVRMDTDGREWWVLLSDLEQVPKGE